ncbi:M23 family metallopeptidase [Litoribacter populi]|uniref:M23 family metallopeptidase n=1 Tax=Litoribacter populi TaxID=2598460 RepID=UPI00117FD545|nr:M23 family metallopeptidase [Litoribacter populi]
MSIQIRVLLIGLLCLSSFGLQAQQFPRLFKKNTPKTQPIEAPSTRSLETFDVQQYLKNLRKETDSLIYKDYVNLKKRLSPISEDTTTLIWAPTNQLVKVSEQIMIDSIWVTAFEYYSSWDSQKINIYNFNPKDFKDTVQIKLYDPFFGSNWHVPLLETRITSDFGFRRIRWHHGTDLKLNTGDPIHSTFDGIVRIKSYDRNGYGYYVVVRHKNGLETLYGHMSKILVEVGQEVRAGDVLGLGGSTGRSSGPHLHYEIRYQGLSINPTEIFDFNIGRIKGDSYTITANSFDHVIKAQQAVFHRVRSGENLGVIARRYGVSINQIARLNGISTRSVIRVGQRLKIK